MPHLPDAILLVQTLPSSRAKLTHMRTFADCRYIFYIRKKKCREIPTGRGSLSHLPRTKWEGKVLYPTYRKRWGGKAFYPTYPGGIEPWLGLIESPD
jgi:hypothetical protein